MFADAIERVGAFTRPIHSVQRLYRHAQPAPGSATLFFVNDLGHAVTCRHVVDAIAHARQLDAQYAAFKEALSAAGEAQRSRIEQEHNLAPGMCIGQLHSFADCVDRIEAITWHTHPTADLAIVEFKGFDRKFYEGHAHFLRDDAAVRPGDLLCRLGYPFPEFTNFYIDEYADALAWTSDGVTATPRFPIEGMVTRFSAEGGIVSGIELSTPGLRGQSGGPLFDAQGRIVGMQSSTRHLHLGFDLTDQHILTDRGPKTVSDHSFLHLGFCVHGSVIKAFLKEKEIPFFEE